MPALPIAGALGIRPEITEQAIPDDERGHYRAVGLGVDYVDRFVR